MLTFSVFNKIDDIESVWKKLCANRKDISPFQEFDLVKMVVEHYWPYWIVKRTVCRFYVFYESSKPVLILPIEKALFANKCYLFAVINGFNYRDLIVGESKYIKPCIDIFIEKVSPIVVEGLPVDSLTYKSLDFNSISYKLRKCRSINFIDIINQKSKETVNTPYDIYFSSLSKSVKQNLRTSYNRLEKQNINYKLLAYFGGNDECVSWDGSLKTIGFDYKKKKILFDKIKALYKKRHVERYRRLFIKELLLEKTFAMYSYENYSKALTLVLTYNDEIAAFMSGYVSRTGVYTVPKLAIDANYAFFSPGMMLINESIKYFLNADLQINILDLSRGNESYKEKMGGIVFHLADFVLSNKK